MAAISHQSPKIACRYTLWTLSLPILPFLHDVLVYTRAGHFTIFPSIQQSTYLALRSIQISLFFLPASGLESSFQLMQGHNFGNN